MKSTLFEVVFCFVMQQLKLVLKKYVRDQRLFLVNEFLVFIGKIHGTGLQQKFDKAYVTGKFHKLGSNPQFALDCQEFFKTQQPIIYKAQISIKQKSNQQP